ncbi:16S rRNA (uracil(1498)-N(3))-methyltransferase [Candidatus Peregrinibacteria bacterium]|nr:16S rRNA (uracil(1498)-N(3))-methyltransferase [Candidatus Peregrinibacteria bacterium]
MHRFFVSRSDHVDEAQALICSDELIHQFTKVLRFARGEKVVLLEGSGFEFVVVLQEFSVKKILGKVLSKKFCETELPLRLVIAQAILKNMERMEWLLQKGTELGVSAFAPLLTDRTERKVLGKEERLQRILKEAAEQSGRGKVPELSGAKRFEKIFFSADWRVAADARSEHALDFGDEVGGAMSAGGQASEHIVVVPHPGAEQKFSEFCKQNLVKNSEKFSGELVICVGPEGGFTDREIEIAKAKGAHVVSLGPRILRAETVALAMTTIVAEVLGEM